MIWSDMIISYHSVPYRTTVQKVQFFDIKSKKYSMKDIMMLWYLRRSNVILRSYESRFIHDMKSCCCFIFVPTYVFVPLPLPYRIKKLVNRIPLLRNSNILWLPDITNMMTLKLYMIKACQARLILLIAMRESKQTVSISFCLNKYEWLPSVMDPVQFWIMYCQ